VFPFTEIQAKKRLQGEGKTTGEKRGAKTARNVSQKPCKKRMPYKYLERGKHVGGGGIKKKGTTGEIRNGN